MSLINKKLIINIYMLSLGINLIRLMHFDVGVFLLVLFFIYLSIHLVYDFNSTIEGLVFVFIKYWHTFIYFVEVLKCIALIWMIATSYRYCQILDIVTLTLKSNAQAETSNNKKRHTVEITKKICLSTDDFSFTYRSLVSIPINSWHSMETAMPLDSMLWIKNCSVIPIWSITFSGWFHICWHSVVRSSHFSCLNVQFIDISLHCFWLTMAIR